MPKNSSCGYAKMDHGSGKCSPWNVRPLKKACEAWYSRVPDSDEPSIGRCSLFAVFKVPSKVELLYMTLPPCLSPMPLLLVALQPFTKSHHILR